MSAGENRFVDFTITAASSGETASQGYVANIKVVATFDRIPDIKDSITVDTLVKPPTIFPPQSQSVN